MKRDLTPEGQKIFEIIDDLDKFHRKVNKTSDGDSGIRPPNTKVSKEARELSWIKMELIKMLVNSQMVVEDCDEIIRELETAEDYIKSDARVAKRLHLGLVDRLNRIIQGLPAFENEEHLTITIDKLKTAFTSKKDYGSR